MTTQYDFLYKIIFIGESGVGKTSLHDRYAYNKYEENKKLTLVCDFQYKHINIQGKVIRVQLWDTAGQERFNSITRSYYKFAQGIILVYDVGNLESFKALENRWLKDLTLYGSEFSRIIVLGNKMDIQQQKREVSFEQGKLFAKTINAQFAEVSAKTGEFVEEALQKLGETIFDYREKNNLNQQNTLQQQNNKKTNNNKEKCSC